MTRDAVHPRYFRGKVRGHHYDHLTRAGKLRRLRKLAEAMLERYDIKDARLSFLQDVDNLLYRVSSPAHGQFLLRMHEISSHSMAELQSEFIWLESMRREGQLPVPEPLYAQDGSLICEVGSIDVPEPRRGVLLRWIPGKRKRTSLRPKDAKLMGSYTARLHKYAEQWTPPMEFVRSAWDWERLFGGSTLLWSAGSAVYQQEQLQVFTAAADRIQRKLQALGKGPDAFGMIHSDLNPSNFVFQAGAAYAIDFEQCGWGYYLFDIEVALSEFEDWGDHSAQLQTAFLEGYQQVRLLPDGYQAYRETFKAMRTIDLVNWILEWESPSFRPWGPKYLSYAVETLTQFMS